MVPSELAISILTIFTFAAVISNFTVASHNLHSFKTSSAFHKSCLEKFGGIWMGQELWLQEKQLSVMSDLGVQFVARSGMEEAVSSGILAGRPYGGTSIAWVPELNHVIKPLVNYRHKRLVCIELASEPKPIIFVSLYMPFYNSSKRDIVLSETLDAISMLEEVIADHPLHSFVIGGDFNTEFSNTSPLDGLWRDCISRHGLICCDQFVRSSSSSSNTQKKYTYFHQSLNQTKWNDHFFISSCLVDASSQHHILEDGGNVSDHLPLMMKLTCKLTPSAPDAPPSPKSPSLKWEKCSEEQKLSYNRRLAELLLISPSQLPCCGISHCKSGACLSAIQAEYDMLIKQICEADKVLPRHKPGVQKSWWTDDLTVLKQRNIDIHRLWLAEGKPGSGATNAERVRVRTEYRKAIKIAQRSPIQTCWNRLHGALAQKNTTQFWKSWKQIYNKNKSHLHSVVNGVTDTNEIIESFSSHFVKVSQPNNEESVKNLNDRFQSAYQEASSSHSENCDCNSHAVSLQAVLDAVFKMKKGKCSDDEKVSAEHFFNAPLSLFDRLQRLFNSMLQHAFVPTQFKMGTIVPIVKDRQGDLGDLNNYRGITIAPTLSKVFEHVLGALFEPFLSTSTYQFGFKRKSSCSHAIFCLKETINYYSKNGSNVFCSFLDATKAFDRLVHSGLFLKLLQRRTPMIFLNIIISWYSNLLCRVRWGQSLGDWFSILAGVRQGGVLSPVLYSIYIDDLVAILSDAGVGCHIKNTFLSILLYADDMCLAAPSLKGLQRLLSMTEAYCREWDISLNRKKSKNMQFGKKHDNLPLLELDGGNIEWVESWTYLGVTLLSHTTFNCCIKEKLQSFYRSANAILRIEGRSNELVMLQLLETHCLSILSYAIEVIVVADERIRRKLRVAYNSIFRQIFGYRTRDSVTDLQHQLQRPTWEELIAKRKESFALNLPHCLVANTFL